MLLNPRAELDKIFCSAWLHQYTLRNHILSFSDILLDWVNQLRARYGEGKIAVGMEQKRGPLLYALCQYDNLVLFPINPRTVANYRKAFQPSRAKSDPVDARLLVELMQKHPEKLDLWVAGCPQTRALRQWVESRRMLVGEKVRGMNSNAFEFTSP